MRIAFDLDDTLIACEFAFPVEERGFLSRLLGHEEIRKGSIALMKRLAGEGWEIWVYTTSFRSPLYVRALFGLYGVRIAGVINQYRHHKTVSKCGKSHQNCSKYPGGVRDRPAGGRVGGGLAGIPAVRFRDGPGETRR